MSFWYESIRTILGSLLAAAIVAWVTQILVERRERRKHYYDLRLDFYLQIVGVVLDNEQLLAARGPHGSFPPAEIQAKWLGVRHRLKLLGSPRVKDAYDRYDSLVRKAVDNPIHARPMPPEDDASVREQLIDAMAEDVQVRKRDRTWTERLPFLAHEPSSRLAREGKGIKR